jgi:hypothetical protein
MSAWEDIGVQAVLDIGDAKACYMATDTNDDEHTAAIEYIAVLESALETLGIKIHETGAVSPTNEGTRA